MEEKTTQTSYTHRESLRFIAKWRARGVVAFCAILLLGCVIGLIFFARPATSELEKRTLTPFPSITPESFLTGEFFTDVSLWYADTYPLREPLVSANLQIKRLYGAQPDQAFYGGNIQSDEIPSSSSGPEEEPTVGGVARPKDVQAPSMQSVEAGLEDKITEGIYVTDNAAYSLYYFSDDAAQTYAATINRAAEILDGKAQVYSIILPTNAGVLLDKELQLQLGGAPQEDAIDYFYSLMDEKVTPVETFDALYAHKDEYLFFRTDHHWTQLGAFYVYESFCKAKGIEAVAYDTWQEVIFEPFRGSYLYEFNLYQLEGNTDSVHARIPKSTNTMICWPNDLDLSTIRENGIIRGFSESSPEDRYQCFAFGNAPLAMIENPTITDGSSCLVVKDSFGNPFVTTLVENYQYIYTIDFRFTSQDLVSFIEENSVDDVIFENSVLFAGTYDASDMLSQIIDGTNPKSQHVSKEMATVVTP